MAQATLVVDIVELQRRTGTRRAVDAELVLPDTELPEEGLGERSVVGGRLAVDVIVEAATEGIVVTGTVAGVSRAPCRRCLDDVDEPWILLGTLIITLAILGPAFAACCFVIYRVLLGEVSRSRRVRSKS